MFSSIINLAETKPILAILIGLVLLVTVGFVNWYGDVKLVSIKWLSANITNGIPSSEKRADRMFMILTNTLSSIAGILLLLGLLYLL